MEEETVYVIKLTGGGQDGSREQKTVTRQQSSIPVLAKEITNLLPSEQRYSASLVQFLGTVHLILAGLSIGLAIMGALLEPEASPYFPGVWAGLTYGICGVAGLLAASRWYMRGQIAWFLASCALAAACAVTSAAVTVLGLVERRQWLHDLREQFRLFPFRSAYSEELEAQMTSVVSTNLIMAGVFEFIWAVFSAKIALDGTLAKEYSLREHLSSGRRLGGEDVNFLSRRVLHVHAATAHLRPPHLDLITGLPATMRVNPLQITADDDDSLHSDSSMTTEDRVIRFLHRHDADNTTDPNAIQLDPTHTFRSVAA